jgi:hypothetical protein
MRGVPALSWNFTDEDLSGDQPNSPSICTEACLVLLSGVEAI